MKEDEVDPKPGVVDAKPPLAQPKELLETLSSAYQFRNKYIAHQEHAAVPRDLAPEQLKTWTTTLTLLYPQSAPVAAGRA